MSHRTGITANDELTDFFGKCRDGRIRIFKVSIRNEALVLDEFAEPQGTWEDDYDKNVLKLVEPSQPCYILYRFDSENSAGYEWMLISWSPDDSPIREKMLYASTKSTLKQEFGGGQLKEELFGTSKTDISLKGYHTYKNSQESPAPLTIAEEEMAELKKNETRVDVGIDTKHQTMQGLMFPVSHDALNAIQLLQQKHINYIQLSIDIEKEVINLEMKKDTELDCLPKFVPTDHARYHLLLFPHSHEGDYLDALVFVYSMPGYSCSIKERMLYSSCKNPLIEFIETSFKVTVHKKIEIDSGNELSEKFLYDELHPKVNLHQPKFSRPKGPPNRGARRITKPTSPKSSPEEEEKS